MLLILLPPVLYILAAAALLILERFNVKVGISWLVAVVVTLVNWVLLLVLRLQVPSLLRITSSGPFSDRAAWFFTLDPISYPYALSIAGLLLAVVLTAAARYNFNEKAGAPWAANLVLGASGYLAVTSGSFLTLVLAWTILDVVDFIVLVTLIKKPAQVQQGLVTFAARLFGTMLAVWGMVSAGPSGEAQVLTGISPQTGVFLLLGAGLRLGVVPLHGAVADDNRTRRGLGTMLRLVAAASSLCVVGRLPANVVTPDWATFLLLMIALAVFYSAIQWLTAPDELSGRPFFVIALAGLATAAAVRGQPQAVVAWGIALILSGGILFLYHARQTSLTVLVGFGLIGLSGLPFTPAASGWTGLVVLPFNLLDVFFILGFTVLLIGYARQALVPGQPLQELERWRQPVYPIGLGILIITQWVLGVFGWPGSFSVGTWWASLITFLLVTGVFVFRRFGPGSTSLEGSTSWFRVVLQRSSRIFASIFSLQWVYRLAGGGFKLAQGFVDAATRVLESEGGVLWALTLLALVLSLLRQQGGMP